MQTRTMFGIMAVILAASIAGLWYFSKTQTYRLSIAAGQSSGQAYQFIKAIQAVTQRYYPEIKVEIFETRGSLQNARLLERGAVQLATTQADLVTGVHAQLVAELYSDAFQLVVREDSGIKTIDDLLGRRVALPPERSGEYDAFWFLASHYDLGKEDMVVFPGTELTTDWLFINGDVDALFRVRAPGDGSVQKLIENVNARIVAIPQASALRLKQPGLGVGTIPKGSYNGRPAVPGRDLETVSVRQLFLARDDVPNEAISKLTSVLFERRRDLIALLPLAGSITVPDRSSGTILPIHEGAQAFFDRDEPSFLQENAEPIAVIISILVILASIALQLSARRRKRVMDVYNRELLLLAQRARVVETFDELDGCDTELAGFVGRIVLAAEAGQIDTNEFNLFHFTYEAVEDAIRDREQQLERALRSAQKSVEKIPRRRRKPSKVGHN